MEYRSRSVRLDDEVWDAVRQNELSANRLLRRVLNLDHGGRDILPDGRLSTCKHCGSEFRDGGNVALAPGTLCSQCFISGHRGFDCGKQCKPTVFSASLEAKIKKNVTPRREIRPKGDKTR